MIGFLIELWPAFMFLTIWCGGVWLLGRAFKAAHRDGQMDRDRYYAWKREWEKTLAKARGRAA